MQLLNTRLTTPTAIVADGAVPVGSVIHKNGNSMAATGSTYRLSATGYYLITVNLSVIVTGTTALTAALNDNNSVIATATATPSAAGESVNLTLIAVVYRKCCNASDLLTVTLADAGTVNEMDVIIERV